MAFARSGDKGVVVRRIMLFMAFFVLAVCPFIIELKTEIKTFKKIAVWQVGILCAILKILI